jgi:hypothetical protein
MPFAVNSGDKFAAILDPIRCHWRYRLSFGFVYSIRPTSHAEDTISLVPPKEPHCHCQFVRLLLLVFDFRASWIRLWIVYEKIADNCLLPCLLRRLSESRLMNNFVSADGLFTFLRQVQPGRPSVNKQAAADRVSHMDFVANAVESRHPSLRSARQTTVFRPKDKPLLDPSKCRLAAGCWIFVCPGSFCCILALA